MSDTTTYALVPNSKCTVSHEVELYFLRNDLRRLRASVRRGAASGQQIVNALDECLDKLGEDYFRKVTEDEAWSMER